MTGNNNDAVGLDPGRTAAPRCRLLSGIVVAMVVVALLGIALGRPPDSPIVRVVSLGPSTGLMGGTLALDTAHGRTYVASTYGRRIDVLDTRTGSLVRTIPVSTAYGLAGPHPVAPWIAADPRTQHLFVLIAQRSPTPPWTTGLRLYILDATRGRVLRSMPVGAASASYALGASPLTIDVRDGRLFVSHLDANQVSVFDTRDGRLLRTLSTARATQASLVVVDAVASDDGAGRALIVDGVSRTVTTVDAVSARVLRRVAVGPYPAAPLVDVRRGTATILSSDRVSVLDTATGRVSRVLWGNPSFGLGYGRAVDETTGTVVTIDFYGQALRLRDSATGQLLRTIPLAGNHSSMVVDTRSGHILVLDEGRYSGRSAPDGSGLFHESDHLVALDETTGVTLRGVSVGVGNGQIMLDEQAQRAVVLTTGGFAPAPARERWAWVPARVRRFLPFLPRPPTGPRATPLTVTFLDTGRL